MAEPPANPVSRFLSVFRYSALAMRIVWDTSASLTVVMALATIVNGILPASIAFVGGLFVDAVAGALTSADDAAIAQARSDALFYVLVEAGLVVFMTGAQRLTTVAGVLRCCSATRST